VFEDEIRSLFVDLLTDERDEQSFARDVKGARVGVITMEKKFVFFERKKV